MPATLLARQPRPSSLKGGPKKDRPRKCRLIGLVRPPSREDRGKTGRVSARSVGSSVLRQGKTERRGERNICPPFKGDGRGAKRRFRGITRSQHTNPPVPATLLARQPRPSSLKGGPKKDRPRKCPLNGLARPLQGRTEAKHSPSAARVEGPEKGRETPSTTESRELKAEG